jgi:cysteine synthase A
MAGRYDSILETVGGTPVVRINRIAPDGVNLFVKVEAFNPMGSVKDRMALAIIEDAERSGKLSPGQTVIEATSGNTGIGLAMVCAQKGYPLVVTMAENFSTERRKLMRFLGAKVVLTPASARGTGMLAKAIELAETHGWFLARQFENEANADVHSRTTAQEILADFAGERLDYWVTGYGTGGTLKGVARVLATERPETRIVVCEPDNSPLLGSGVAQPEPADGGLAATHPVFRPHLMQGWTPDFIAKLADDARDADLIDGIVPINGDDAVRVSKDLARKEGIFVGLSGGATLAGALRVCESASEGTTVLCMLPDTGERYLTTPLFEEIPTEMSDEEIEISRSSPNFRFDAPTCAIPGKGADRPAESTPEVEDLVEKIVSDPGQPVVMFAFEWCEFCWSVRKLFSEYAIPYRSVDLDSVVYQKDDLGGRIRSALAKRTSFTTIPQVFVGGEFVGGCLETLEAFKEGRLQKLLAGSKVEYDASKSTDPYDCLPAWLHPR